MVAQLAVGVLGGAALWLAFNWLWRRSAVAALVVALAVTIGLVLLVRDPPSRRPADHGARRAGRPGRHRVPGGAAAGGRCLPRPRSRSRCPRRRCTRDRAAGVRAGRRARLRRRRADGLGRPGQPGHGRAVARLARAGMPVLAVHAPCLLITQRVWSPDPVVRLRRAGRRPPQTWARRTVVLHPPFRWQRRYAGGSPTGRRAGGRDRGRDRGGEHVPGARVAGSARCSATPRRSTRPTSATGTTRWTCRTPRPPHRTRWRWPSGWATGCAHMHLADGSGAPTRRAPGARPRHPAVRRGVRAAGARRVRRQGRAGDQHPAGPRRPARGRRTLAESLLFARLHLEAADRARGAGCRCLEAAPAAGSAPGGAGGDSARCTPDNLI